jgi:hypothetical protein
MLNPLLCVFRDGEAFCEGCKRKALLRVFRRFAVVRDSLPQIQRSVVVGVIIMGVVVGVEQLKAFPQRRGLTAARRSETAEVELR